MGPSVASVSTAPPPANQSSSKPAQSDSSGESFETALHQVKHAQARKTAKPKSTEIEDSGRMSKKTAKAPANAKEKSQKPDDGPSEFDKQPADSQSSKQPRQKAQPKESPLEQGVPVAIPVGTSVQVANPPSVAAGEKDVKTSAQQPSVGKAEKSVVKPVTLPAPADDQTADVKASRPDSNSTATPAEAGDNSDESPSDESLSIPTKPKRLSLDAKAEKTDVRSGSDKPATAGADLQTTTNVDVSGVATVLSAAPVAPATQTKSKEDQPTSGVNGVLATDARSPAPLQAAPLSKPAVADPTAQFAELNHPKLVTAISGQLLPSGGTMTLRLDPPELGAMHVRVEVRDGLMTASFETSNDQATKLLSHSLDQLKSSLEAQGVTVEKLHVTQSSRPQSSSSQNGQQDHSGQRQDSASQQEQQRREMMQRLWRRLLKGQDPLDLVA